MGHWEQAALDFAQAREQEPDNARLWGWQALAQLAAGNTSGYQRSCAAMLARFSRSDRGEDAWGIVWACVVGLIGGLFPAIRAARLPVATALRAL